MGTFRRLSAEAPNAESAVLSSFSAAVVAMTSTHSTGVTEADTQPNTFLTPPAPALSCTACHRLLRIPVLSIVCGHTFCSDCVAVTTMCPVDYASISRDTTVPNLALSMQIDELKVYCRYARFHSNSSGFVPPLIQTTPRANTNRLTINLPNHLRGSQQSISSLPSQSDSHGQSHLQSQQSAVIDFGLDPTACTMVLKFGSRKDHESKCPFSPVSCPFSRRCGKILRRNLAMHLDGCQYRIQPPSKHDEELSHLTDLYASTKARYDALVARLDELEQQNGIVGHQIQQLLDTAAQQPPVRD